MRLDQLFSGPKVEAMQARLESVAADFGVSIRRHERAPNTRKALALSEFAARQGALDRWREAAMAAHWRDGRDLEAPEVLSDLAVEAGLDPAQALAFLEAPEVPRILEAQREEARRWGVTGIPTWYLLPEGWTPEDGVPPSGPRPVRVVGCQPMEVVNRAAELAGAALRSP